MEDTLCEGNVKMDTKMKSSLLYCFSFCIFYVILLYKTNSVLIALHLFPFLVLEKNYEKLLYMYTFI